LSFVQTCQKLFSCQDSSFLWQSLQTTIRKKYQLELVLQYFINSFASGNQTILMKLKV
jgi:hypothetical protein